MHRSLEVIILGAAIDGSIDASEQAYILQILNSNKTMSKFTRADLQKIQKRLFNKLAEGITPKMIVQSLKEQFSEHLKLQIYALVLDVVHINGDLDKSESDFLRMLSETWSLNETDIRNLQFSASLRFGEIG